MKVLRRSRWTAIMAVLMLVVMLAGCGGQSQPTTQKQTAPAPAKEPEQVLLTSVPEDPNSLDPHKTSMASASAIMSLIYDRLVYIGDDKLPHPQLAESWQIKDGGKTVVFKIRQGVKFHDGTDLDAEAVAFTFNRLIDPKTAAPAKGWIGPLEKVEATGKYEATFRFSKPYAPLFTQLSTSYMGIISPTAVKKYGDQFGRNPVGSGPMKFESWDPANQIVLSRNENYKSWRQDVKNTGPWHLKKMVYKIVPEAGTRLAALEKGELHVTGAPPEEIPRLEKDNRFKVIAWKEATNFTFLEFNRKKPPFDDVRVRKAIGYAIDNKAILQGAISGLATENYNPMPVGVAGHDPAIGKEYGFKYDVETAKKLLAEAGWKDTNKDGILDKGGQPFRVKLWTYNLSNVTKSCEIIKEYLKAVGIDAQIEIMETGTLIGKLPEGQHHFNIMRWTWPDPVILSLLFKSPGWTKMYSNKEVDAILEKCDTTLDPSERLKYVKEAQIALLKDAAIIPIFTDWIFTVARAQVDGLRMDALGGLLFHDVKIK